jgi:hypothetical protein
MDVSTAYRMGTAVFFLVVCEGARNVKQGGGSLLWGRGAANSPAWRREDAMSATLGVALELCLFYAQLWACMVPHILVLLLT